MSNALLRILTALVGVPLLVGLAYVGGWPLALVLAAVALAAQHELYRMMEEGGLRPFKTVGLLLGACMALRPAAPFLVALATALFIGLVLAYPFVSERTKPLDDLAATAFGAIYPTTLFVFLTDLRLARGPDVGDLDAFFLTLAVFLMIWATDTFAYYVGRSLGRHLLAPTISPKKTWEGSVGGVLGATAVAVALKLTVLQFLPWPHLIVLAVLCGVVSQFGDLAESRMKRSVGVKDSGAILPGHGGLLDRFDAVIVTAPLAYFYLAFVARLYG